ncbi:MAG: phosphatidylglycerol lysyltransferase domain-containing protein [Spirochaetaceae bacterium]|nr:phosphatidylglycerol lysyltransferase domain-containing protein [Spirochaetaceae bacterium]
MARELKSEMHPYLSLTADGVSEYTFSNLYLFRNRYTYRVSRMPNQAIILSGERDGKRFFMTPFASPDRETAEDLFRTHDYWKGIPESLAQSNRTDWDAWGIELAEDRDNFDYLYLRTDLANLAGKKYHKKRNLVHAFTSAYTYSEAPLSEQHIPDAVTVLERWREDKGEDGDYRAAREALNQFGTLEMQGVIYYVEGNPAGWCLGESLAGGRMFAIHFEKAIDEYKGIYQFINQAFAARLPEYYLHINREQDLGDEGLRQAKMTYRPAGFVRKYIGKKPG